MSASGLPRFAEWLLRHAIADPVAREGVLGDMGEEYTTFIRRHPNAFGPILFSIITFGMATRFALDRLRGARRLRSNPNGGRWFRADRGASGAGRYRITKIGRTALQDYMTTIQLLIDAVQIVDRR